MRGRVRVPLFVVALALLGLLGLLAALQFRWLGQISDASRDRLRATLESGASAFARDFDAELTRAYLLFQVDPLGDVEDLPASFAARYDRWHATSKYPRLIKNLYLFTSEEKSQLQKFDPVTRSFAPVEWPASMKDWRAHVLDTTAEPSTGRSGDYFIRRIGSPIWDSVPAIVVPSPLLPAGNAHTAGGRQSLPRVIHTILEIDESYVSHEMLPALAEQHVMQSGGAEIQLAVVSRSPGGRVIYHSSETFNPAPGAHADATADLFAIRTQDFGRVASEIHRFVSFAATQRFGSEKSARQGPTDVVTEHQPVIVVERTESGPAPSTGPGQTQTTTAGLTRITPTAPSWQLILAHQSGSLEAAVAVARRRNLLVSSSILGVLGASMALLLLATRRAQRLAQQQMEFVATVSHELRTPLAVIRSAAENLADGIVEDGPQVRKYGELVRGEGRRLTDMVEQILEFSGIQSGERRLNAVAVPIGPLVRDVVDASVSLATAARIDLEQDLPDDLPPVLGDEPALRRVFQNLLANAIKYGAAGGWIRIDVRRQGNDVLVTVADRGIGIDPSEHERIFDPFYRAAAVVEAQIQGAGLGLSLVKRIVEAHGGAISVRSAPGRRRGVHRPSSHRLCQARAKGFRFGPPCSHSARRPWRQGAPLLVKRVLLVEDEPGLVLTLTDRLSREGYDVQSSSDGESGLARATRETFDLVLLDVMLPRLGGFDVVRELRKQSIETPVIMLTARGQVVDKVVGLKLGADDYVTKPFEMVELLARIEAKLRRSPAKIQPAADISSARFRLISDVPRSPRAVRRWICRRANSSCSGTSSSTVARR